MRGAASISLWVLSYAFMTLARYGRLRLKDHAQRAKMGLFSVLLLSWGIAFSGMAFQYRPTASASTGMAARFPWYSPK